MKNIIYYVENQLQPMNQVNFNPVDSLILSHLANFELEGIVGNLNELKPYVYIKDLIRAEYFHQMIDFLIFPKMNKDLLFALASSPRFRNIKINFFEKKFCPECEKQFCAVTFILDKYNAYISFRGTDDSIVGWKEDFNMAFVSPVPSQIEGTEYVNKVSRLIPQNLYIGGHSKGGNIAVYSAMKCKKNIQPRINTVFSHDGPGFREEIIRSNEFNNIKDKINKTMPYSSIVGMLLEYHEDYKVVNSSGLPIFQHNPFKWDVCLEDFNYVKDVSSGSKYFNKTLNEWLSNISDAKRKLFIDSLYEVLISTNANGFTELINNWKTNLPIILNSLKNMDPEIKKMILQLLKELRNLYIKNLYPIENLNRIKMPKKPIIKRKFKIKKSSNKKNYCTVKIRRHKKPG